MQQQTQIYSGLSEREVIESRARHGENILTPPAKKSLFLQFLEKFKDPLILILLVAGVLSVGISVPISVIRSRSDNHLCGVYRIAAQYLSQ